MPKSRSNSFESQHSKNLLAWSSEYLNRPLHMWPSALGMLQLEVTLTVLHMSTTERAKITHSFCWKKPKETFKHHHIFLILLESVYGWQVSSQLRIFNFGVKRWCGGKKKVRCYTILHLISRMKWYTFNSHVLTAFSIQEDCIYITDANFDWTLGDIWLAYINISKSTTWLYFFCLLFPSSFLTFIFEIKRKLLLLLLL